MLGLDNPIHLLFLGVLMLLVFGAKRLPEMGHSLGAGLRGFKDSLTSDGEPSAIAEHAARDTAEAPSEDVASDADHSRQLAPAEPVA
ncbi:MAG: twin-arginine translocase TatA/TatE family subunit [Solirubrobacteraceae bacterium]